MIWDSIFFLFFKIFSIFILFSNSSLLRSESKFYSSRSEVFKSIVLQNFLISSWSKILFVFSDFFFPISSLLLNLEVLIFICSTESSSTCSPVALSPPAMAADPTTGGGEAESFFRAAPPLRDQDRVAGDLADFVARHSGKSLPPSPPPSLSSDLISFDASRGWVSCWSRSCLVVGRERRRRRRRGEARRGGLRHLRRHDGAPGAAVRAIHRQLQLRPERGRVHRVCLVTLIAVLLSALYYNCLVLIFSLLVKFRYFLKAGYAVIFIYRR